MKIGLALSGGGFKGAAHIGVLEEIEKTGVKPDIIAGVSAGAIVGLLYAYGGAKNVNDFFQEIIETGMLTRKKVILSRNPDRIFGNIESLLRKYVPVDDFSKLNRKFFCLTTDLETGKSVKFDSGDPIAAVMASSAYPGVFPAQKIDNHIYVDGGLIENFPASALKKSGCKFVIGSSLDGFRKTKIERVTRTKVLSRALEIIDDNTTRRGYEFCDFLFNPPLNKFKWYSFEKVAEMRQIGQKYAKDRIKKLHIIG